MKVTTKVEMRPKERDEGTNPVSTDRKKWIKFGPQRGTLVSRQDGKWNCTREGFLQGSGVVFRKKSEVL
jgi:hypothetical protein